MGKEVGEYYLYLNARGIMGDKLKHIAFLLGDSNCGKSTQTKVFQQSFGSYTGSFNGECFSLKNNQSQDEAQMMRWAYLLRHKRLLFSNELNNTIKLNGNMIKKVASGGDRLVGRVHGGLETEFTPNYMCNVFANDITEITPYDTAVQNRLIVFPFKKIYVDNPTEDYHLKKDDNVDDEIRTEKFQKAMIGIIIHQYKNFRKKGEKPLPYEIKQAKEQWINQQANVIDMFLDSYHFTNNTEEDFITNDELKEWSVNSKTGISDAKLIIEIKKYADRHKFKIDKRFKKIDKKNKRVWFGMKEGVKEDTP